VAEGYHGVHEKLVDRFSTKGDALYVLFAGFVAIPVNGIATYLLKQALLLPSLSPALFTFFMKPLTSRPHSGTLSSDTSSSQATFSFRE
jgi:hypothetical protein